MARVCEICGKEKSIGNYRKLLRGHYNVTGKRAFKPNLQRVRYQGRRVLSCVQCIRTLHKDAKASKAGI
ncbi:MAG: L28 family ribosomal protein [Candidatus Andersenbacteria bacterium]